MTERVVAAHALEDVLLSIAGQKILLVGTGQVLNTAQLVACRPVGIRVVVLVLNIRLSFFCVVLFGFAR